MKAGEVADTTMTLDSVILTEKRSNVNADVEGNMKRLKPQQFSDSTKQNELVEIAKQSCQSP